MNVWMVLAREWKVWIRGFLEVSDGREGWDGGIVEVIYGREELDDWLF